MARLSELKKRKMKGFRQEFETMDTPITELKVSHHASEHLHLVCPVNEVTEEGTYQDLVRISCLMNSSTM